MAFTNRGLFRLLEAALQDAAWPASFYAALVTDTPTIATNLFSQLSEIGAGNGYVAGGQQIARSAIGFPSVTEEDVNQRAIGRAANVVWTASSGPIPASGSPAIYAVLLDDNVTVADREVWAYASIAQGAVTNGADLTLTNWDFILRQP